MGKQNSQRITIPPAIRQIVLLEAGYKCANPTCRHILTLELHHIVWVKNGGGNDPDNLVALCPNCHSLHTAGHIPADAIPCWKSLLVSLNSSIRASADISLCSIKRNSGLRLRKIRLNDPHLSVSRVTDWECCPVCSYRDWSRSQDGSAGRRISVEVCHRSR